MGTGNNRNSGYERAAADWYCEPRRAIDALLDTEEFEFSVFDPACGGGNIPEACRARGMAAAGSDLVNRGYPIGQPRDFLTFDAQYANVVTNPPYALAEQFVLRALPRTLYKVAVIVRTAFLEGQSRHRRLFKPHPPARIWQFSSRVSMPPGGTDVQARNGSVAYCWIVWDRSHVGPPAFGWLP